MENNTDFKEGEDMLASLLSNLSLNEKSDEDAMKNIDLDTIKDIFLEKDNLEKYALERYALAVLSAFSSLEKYVLEQSSLDVLANNKKRSRYNLTKHLGLLTSIKFEVERLIKQLLANAPQD